VPVPALKTEKPVIDAAIAAKVKRLVPSEYSTNLENELARKLPIVTDKVEIRKYIESVLPTETTSWTSVNNGPFFDMGIERGFLGPQVQSGKATFRDGGAKPLITSTLADISTGVAKVLQAEFFEETANKPVYIYSFATTERDVTRVVGKVTGKDFGTVEGGQIQDINVAQLVEEAKQATSKGFMSGWFNYYFQFMYGDGYGGDFRYQAWNERFGMPVRSEEEMEKEVKRILDL
jgi:hypothetical protein